MVINVHSGEGTPNSEASGCGTGGCGSGVCGNGLEKVYPTAAVRYGYMRSIGEFRYPSSDMRFGCGAEVIIQSNRGIEVGEMVSLTCDGCDKCVSRDQIRRYVEASGPEYYSFSNGKILRLATAEDLADWEHIRAETLRKKAFCQEQADTYNLPMKVLECEHLFGGERIIFYFMAEGRVDFRALVKGLAEEFQTRIEMRQVGARDEARLLADYETCGRECCCRNFLKTLKPISMKMAKMQKATLDPAKVSGRCGRLKCCLRYEHASYEDLDRRLPRMGAKVFCEDGVGAVVARQILTQLVQVQTDDGGRFTAPVEALVSEEEYLRRKAEKARLAAPPAPAARQNAGRAGTNNAAAEESPRSRRSRRSRRRGGPAPEGGTNVVPPGSPADSNVRPPPRGAGGEPGAPPNESSAPAPGRQANGAAPRRRRRRNRRPSRGPGDQRPNGGPSSPGPIS